MASATVSCSSALAAIGMGGELPMGLNSGCSMEVQAASTVTTATMGITSRGMCIVGEATRSVCS